MKDSTESELYGYDAPRSPWAVYRLDEFDRGQLNQAKDEANRRAVRWQFGRRQTAVSKGRKPRRGGNWDQTVLDGTTESRTHNDVNELTQRTIGQDPSISLTYDDAGNLTQDGDSDGDHKYTWDYRNRLIEVEEKQSGNWNTVPEYKYDGKTRRILKVVTNKGDLNGTTRFVWGGSYEQLATSNDQLAGWQCLEERDGSGNLVARFTYAPGYIDAPARQERDLNADDDFGDDDEVVWYHANTLFSVYALTDGSENVVERYRYDAYGACAVLDADFSADSDGISDVGNPYRFTARRLDVESRLMQYRHRYYAPHLGRFISRDSAGYIDAYNLVSYALGRPTVLADPEGRAVVVVAITIYCAGRGISHCILAGLYTHECTDCKVRTIRYLNHAADNWNGSAEDFVELLKVVRPGAECTDLCVKAGEHGIKGLKWLLGGLVVKYAVTW